MSDDHVSPRRITGAQVSEMRDHYWDLMPSTRKTALDVRTHLAAKGPIILPGDLEIAGAEAWISRMPHQWTGPQKILQDCIAKRWEIKRSVTSGGYGAGSVSDRLEQPLNAIMRDDRAGFPWEAYNDLVLNEGLGFGTVSLEGITDWRSNRPTLYQANADSLEPEQLQKRFSMDGQNRLRGDDDWDRDSVDLNRAHKAMQTESHDYAARHLPHRQRALSITSCAPIWGPDLTLEGLIVDSWWTPQALIRRHIRLSKDKAGAQMYPLGTSGTSGESAAGSGPGARIKITEAWLQDEDGLPYVAYCANGGGSPLYAWQGTSDGDKPWVADMARLGPNKDKLLTRLPVSWAWGLGWPGVSDLDERALAFVRPFLQNWKNLDSLMTAIIVFAQWRAFPALIEEDPIGANAADTVEDDEPNAPELGFMRITKVRGRITEVGTQGIANGVLQAMSILSGENKEQMNDSAEGGASGFAMSLDAAFQDKALHTVHKNVLKAASMHASYVLESGKLLGEAYDEPIRVYQIADVLVEQEKPSSTRQLLVLDPELVGDSYDVEAVPVKTPGENPAVRQQNAGLVKEGFYDKRWFLEQDGYPAPEEMAMRVAWQQALESEPGQAATFRLLEQFVSDEFTQQITAAITVGQANQQGLPTPYADGTSVPPDMLMAGPQAGGGMPGLTTPAPIANSLAATIGAGLQTGPINNAAAAGGVIPEALVGGPV